MGREGGRDGGREMVGGLTYVTGVVCRSKYELRGSVVARAYVGNIRFSLHQNLGTVREERYTSHTDHHDWRDPRAQVL